MSDKSNVMTYAHGLWQRVFKQVASEYPEIKAEHMYVDALCLQMVRDPRQFHVIVTNNMFGDIITDLAAGLQGGLGMAASGNIHPGKTSMFEPVHGSAPPIAGKNIANPIGAILTAAMMLKHLGLTAEAVKIEGGQKRAELIHRLRDAELPVMGHIGLTPQSLHAMGGYKVQGKSLGAIEELMRDAVALQRAGVFAIVLEGVPREVAAMITAEVHVPTIGIGAGPDCDGQVLVLHDMLNLSFVPPAKFVRQYSDVAAIIRGALEHFRQDVERGAYPDDAESYHLPPETKAALDAISARKASMKR